MDHDEKARLGAHMLPGSHFESTLWRIQGMRASRVHTAILRAPQRAAGRLLAAVLPLTAIPWPASYIVVMAASSMPVRQFPNSRSTRIECNALLHST